MRIRSCCVNIVMRYSFRIWEQARRLQPQADTIMPFVKAAGASGLTRRQLGGAVDLERVVLDDLLAGLVNVGMLILAKDARGPVYRTAE